MKRWTKNFLALLIAVMMICAMLPATALAAEKPNKPTLEKKVNGGESTSAAAGETVEFTLTSNVPGDLWKCFSFVTTDQVSGDEGEGGDGDTGIAGQAFIAPLNLEWFTNDGTPITGAKYELTFHDEMNEKLTMKNGTLKVTIGDTVLTAEQYTYTANPEDGCTFHVTLDLVQLYMDEVIHDQAFSKTTPIVVTYTATLSSDATAGTYQNTSWVSWEKLIVERPGPDTPVDPDDPDTPPDGPEEPEESEEDTVDVYTYKIKLVKFDKEDNTLLSGAKFKLEKWNEEENTWEQIGNEQTTGEDGIVAWDGLGAGSYQLTETAPPQGYVQADDSMPVTLPNDADRTQVATVEFPNGGVPSTGGSGTVMYTVAGLALLCCAAGVLVISRKKKTNQ